MAAATRAPEVDLYRDTPIRYLGYANELGESFRPLYPKLVAPSYAISFGYVALDTVDKVHCTTYRCACTWCRRLPRDHSRPAPFTDRAVRCVRVCVCGWCMVHMQPVLVSHL